LWKPFVEFVERAVMRQVIASPRPTLEGLREAMPLRPDKFVFEGPVGDSSLPAALLKLDSIHFDFPSAAPSCDGSGDRITGVVFTPRGKPRRVILLIPGWLAKSRRYFLFLAKRLARRGALAAVMDLPAHFGRAPRGSLNGTRFLSGDPWLSWIYFRQSVSDARTVIRALKTTVADGSVTACGFSLGGWVAGAAASLEMNCAATLVTPATDPGGLLRRSPLLAAIRAELEQSGHDVESIARDAEPLALAALPPPGDGCRIMAAQWDEVIPLDFLEVLSRQWHAPIELFPVGHMTPYISPHFLSRFLRSFTA
jgi:alpha/beta hydrolase family protein